MKANENKSVCFVLYLVKKTYQRALAAGATAVAAEGAAAFDVTTPDWKLMISLYSSKSISPSPLVSAKLMSASI